MSRNKIDWQTDSYVIFKNHKIASVFNLPIGYNQDNGVQHTNKFKMIMKRAIYPFFKLYSDCFIDGFIEREVGNFINKYIREDSISLEIGCGDMSLRKYIPSNLYYNAIDLRLSDFHLAKALRYKKNINICLASATEIPVQSNTVSLIISTETFEHIPEIDKALKEITRISTNNAILICSIPNNYSIKYIKKGPNSQHVNNWTFSGFIEYMKSYNLVYVEGFMKGKWIPFPLWFTKTSYQLPISSKLEPYNTNFFFVFMINK